MNEARMYEDNYRGIFREQEEFLACLSRISESSYWKRRKAKNLRIVAIKEGSQIAEEMKEKYSNEGLDEGIISDTIVNTGLLLKDKEKYYPVRGCAIKSILDRAGIAGNGLRKVEKNVYARILNDLLKVAKGEALIRVSEGKVSAVLSGDCNDYSILDVEELFLHTVDYLNSNFKGCNYLGGFYEHDMVSGMWELSGEDKLLEAYKKILALDGKTPEEMKPVIRITTSDTGAGAANIYPMMVCGADNMTINIGTPLRLEHRNGNNIVDFDNQLKQIYAKYERATVNLINLLGITILNPVNCMKGVMEKLKIPKRYQAEAIDLFKAQYGEDICSAHDIYFGISEILYMMTCEGEHGSKIIRMEETVSRALALDWREFDIPEV